MKRNYMTTGRGATRGIKATEAGIQAYETRTQAEVEASIPEGSERYLKEANGRRYYVYWAPGSKEAQVSKGWQA